MALWVLWGDDEIPVTHLYDADREEVDEVKHALTFVAGPLPNGAGLAGRVADFPEIHQH